MGLILDDNGAILADTNSASARTLFDDLTVLDTLHVGLFFSIGEGIATMQIDPGAPIIQCFGVPWTLDLNGGNLLNAELEAGSVSYAEMQDVSAASMLLGRGSAAGAGDVQEIVLGTNLSMAGTTLNAAGGAGGDPAVNSYAPGSFTVATEKYAVMSKRLQLTGAQQLAVQGTGRLRIT
jgi:hypothetical protein